MDREAAPSAEPRTTRRWVARALALAFLSGSVFVIMGGIASALEIDDPLADVTDVVDDVTGVVTDTAEPVLEGVTETVEPIVDDVTETVEPIVDEVTETVGPIVDEVVDTVDEVTDAVEPVVDDVTDTVSDVVDPIVDVVEPVVDDTTDVIGDVLDPSVPPSEDGVVAPPPGGSDSGPDRERRGIALVLADGDAVWWEPGAVLFTASWNTDASTPSVPTTFGDLSSSGVASSSTAPLGAPFGGVDPGGALGVGALLAILTLSLRLLLPLIRSTNAPGVPGLRSAALALSVERPG